MIHGRQAPTFREEGIQNKYTGKILEVISKNNAMVDLSVIIIFILHLVRTFTPYLLLIKTL